MNGQLQKKSVRYNNYVFHTCYHPLLWCQCYQLNLNSVLQLIHADMCFFQFFTGEFGIVYKGLLMNWNKVPVQGVAVKALKGDTQV